MMKNTLMTPYRPSNGTEGMIFQETYCEHCAAFLEKTEQKKMRMQSRRRKQHADGQQDFDALLRN